jgi:hypothetical protein
MKVYLFEYKSLYFEQIIIGVVEAINRNDAIYTNL